MRDVRTLLGDRFEVVKGKEDELFEGLDRTTGRPVLLVLLGGFPCALRRERFAHAARTLRNLSSPRLVAPLAEGLTPIDGLWWQAFPVPPGRSLRDRRATSPDLLATTQAICLALAEAHACGLVLRNLQPSGLFLDPMRPNCAWLLAPRPALPQGNGRSLDARRPAPLGMTDGAHLDACSDVWSLGAILAQLWAGAVPDLTSEHPTRRPASLLSSLFRPEQEIPEALEALVIRCLEQTRERRFRDGVEVARALASIEGGDPALRARLRALPEAQPEEVDWVEVERLAQMLVDAIHPTLSMRPIYERTEARRMMAAQHLGRGEAQKALVVLERAQADDPTEEIARACEQLRSALAQGRSSR